MGIWGQRSLARENRLWDRRADAYADLADYVIRESLRASLTFPLIGTGDKAAMMPPPLTEEQWWALHGRLAAFGSRTIRDAVDEVLKLRVRFGSSVAYLRDVVDNRPAPGDHQWAEEQKHARGEVDRLRIELRDACERVAELVGVELRARPRTARGITWKRSRPSG